MGSETMSTASTRYPHPNLYSESVIPEIPRLRGRRVYRRPLAVYSIFVSISLVLLGSMAVASLPL